MLAGGGAVGSAGGSRGRILHARRWRPWTKARRSKSPISAAAGGDSDRRIGPARRRREARSPKRRGQLARPQPRSMIWWRPASSSTATGWLAAAGGRPGAGRGGNGPRRGNEADGDCRQCGLRQRPVARCRSQGADRCRQAPGRRPWHTALADLRTAVEASASLTDPVQSLDCRPRCAGQVAGVFGCAARGLQRPGQQEIGRPAAAGAERRPWRPLRPLRSLRRQRLPPPVATTTTTASSSPRAGVSGSKRSQLSSIVSSGRSMAKEVIRMGSGGTATQKANAAARQELRQISGECG